MTLGFEVRWLFLIYIYSISTVILNLIRKQLVHQDDFQPLHLYDQSKSTYAPRLFLCEIYISMSNKTLTHFTLTCTVIDHLSDFYFMFRRRSIVVKIYIITVRTLINILILIRYIWYTKKYTNKLRFLLHFCLQYLTNQIK